MIEIQGLTKVYGATAVVDDVSMRIDAGAITTVVGTSGSGKSTLLRMINRLVEPSAGRVLIDGRDTRDAAPAALRRRIGYVIQGNGLFPHWTAARNVATVPTLLGWPRPEVERRVDELMRMLDLDPGEIGPRYPHQLSGGQAQRVGVARALAARPDMLLMDEPFGALDPLLRQRAQSDLRALQRRQGATVVLVTHDIAEAIRLGDRVAVMRAGRLEQIGAPAQILRDPATPFVRDLVGERDRAFRLLSLLPLEAALCAGEAEGEAMPVTASLSDALAEMIWSGRARLPVADASGRRLGVVERDAIFAADGRGRAGPSRGKRGEEGEG